MKTCELVYFGKSGNAEVWSEYGIAYAVRSGDAESVYRATFAEACQVAAQVAMGAS